MISFMIVGGIVSSRLKRKFKKYSKIATHSGLSGKEIAEKMLSDNNISDVKVISVVGKLTDHYNPNDKTVITGMVGAPACGDVMRLQIKVNGEGVIEDAKFKTYGCGSAIASSSLLTEWVKGKSLTEASLIKNSDIAEELALPPVKIHCSVLAEDAITAAIEDYKNKAK